MVKKAYTEIHAILEANQDKKVSDVMSELLPLMQPKAGGSGAASTFHRDEQGKVVGIFCYYHKLWMDPSVVEFGAKASSPTGYNNMCKDGVSKWTKQQNTIRKGKDELLQQVVAGELAADQLAARIEELEASAKEIIPREDGYGYETLEELLAA